MGKYVESALLPGEYVVAEARPHWAIFIAPCLLLLAGLWLSNEVGEEATPLARWFLAGVAAAWGAIRVLVFTSTDMAITDKRVIAKFGVLSRNVVDISNLKIEGVTYQQGLLGRIFGYGSVLVRGTGAGQVPVPFIARPNEFKHEISRVLHSF